MYGNFAPVSGGGGFVLAQFLFDCSFKSMAVLFVRQVFSPQHIVLCPCPSMI